MLSPLLFNLLVDNLAAAIRPGVRLMVSDPLRLVWTLPDGSPSVLVQVGRHGLRADSGSSDLFRSSGWCASSIGPQCRYLIVLAPFLRWRATVCSISPAHGVTVKVYQSLLPFLCSVRMSCPGRSGTLWRRPRSPAPGAASAQWCRTVPDHPSASIFPRGPTGALPPFVQSRSRTLAILASLKALLRPVSLGGSLAKSAHVRTVTNTSLTAMACDLRGVRVDLPTNHCSSAQHNPIYSRNLPFARSRSWAWGPFLNRSVCLSSVTDLWHALCASTTTVLSSTISAWPARPGPLKFQPPSFPCVPGIWNSFDIQFVA